MTTFGSLFSGIGGFDLGLELAGLQCKWQCELNDFAIKILERHWPNVKRFKDVRDVNGKNAATVDVIVGGFPCQDLSIAGSRKGLAGEQSGLWFEFERVIRDILPLWVVIENVPGLLSSNGGIDIQTIIDTLTQIGYTVDVDIKDAQEFGVAQRRRRVFLTCVRLDGLLKQKTPLSRQISADLLAQTLLNIWGAIQPALSLVPLRSVYDKPSERCEVLLSKTMSLFEITLERLACKPSQNIWDVLLDQFGGVETSLEFGSTASAELPAPQLPGKAMCESLLRRIMAGSGDSSISTLLSSALADGCKLANKSITSAWTQETTDQAIFIFAVASLNTIAHIIPSLDWSVNCWSVAQSALMLLQENMNYARQTSSQLFIGPGLRDGWWDYLCTASHIESELEHRVGNIRVAEVLFESAGLCGHPPARREAGQGVAGTIAGSSNGGGANGPGRDVDSVDTLILEPQAGVSANDRTWVMDQPGRTRSITANRTLAVTYNIQHNDGGEHRRKDRPNGGLYVNETDTALTVGTTDATVVAYALNHHHSRLDGESETFIFEPRYARNGRGSPDIIAPPLKVENGQTGKGDGAPVVAYKQSNQVPAVGVRRLTPTECERLQGFPDGWTAGQSDSARYRQLGNAVTVPVIKWIGERIEKTKDN